MLDGYTCQLLQTSVQNVQLEAEGEEISQTEHVLYKIKKLRQQYIKYAVRNHFKCLKAVLCTVIDDNVKPWLTVLWKQRWNNSQTFQIWPPLAAAAAGHMRQKQLQIVTINRLSSFNSPVLTGAVCLCGSHSPWNEGVTGYCVRVCKLHLTGCRSKQHG